MIDAIRKMMAKRRAELRKPDPRVYPKNGQDMTTSQYVEKYWAINFPHHDPSKFFESKS
jgi:hypothetical protein